MLPGYNHNIRHHGQIFHVQTEDSGIENPHIITHVFVGGNIVASRKSTYSELLGQPDLDEVVRTMMQEQHKAMLKSLVQGAFDEALPDVAGDFPLQAEDPAAGSGVPEPVAHHHSAEVAAHEPLFGDDFISEKTLDEVIMAYLSEDMSVPE